MGSGSSSIAINRYRASSAMDDDEVKAMSSAVVRHRDASNSFILEKVDLPAGKSMGKMRKGCVSPDVLDVPVLNRHPFIDYRFMKKIGEGLHSIVYKAVNVLDEQYRVAIKEVRTNEMTKSELEDFNYEINTLSQLHHPNILRVAAIYQPTSSTKPQGQYYVASEYLRGGELLPALCSRQVFCEQDIRILMSQLLSAIAYLHSRGVVHGRIIPESIVLSEPTFQNAQLKLVDFSHADCLSSRRKHFEEREIDTPFLAPELFLKNGSFNWKNISSACDVWSFGRVLSVLLTGTYPQLNTMNNQEDCNVLFYNENWTHISDECKAVIEATQAIDPSRRPTAFELLDFEWFRQPIFAEKLNENPENNLSQQLCDLSANLPHLIDYMNERFLSTSLLVSSGIVRFMKVGRYRNERKMARINNNSPFVPMSVSDDD